MKPDSLRDHTQKSTNILVSQQDSHCSVAHAEDSVQRLRHLRGKWMYPKDLIKACSENSSFC